MAVVYTPMGIMEHMVQNSLKHYYGYGIKPGCGMGGGLWR